MNPTHSSPRDLPEPSDKAAELDDNTGADFGTATAGTAGTAGSPAAPGGDSQLRADLVAAERRIAELEAQLTRLSREAGANDDQSLLLDADSNLYSEAYFNVALDARIAAAKRHLRPVAVALVEFSEGTGTNRAPAPVSRGADAIRETLRDADTACRLKDGTFALILEDTPENGAVWTVERVRRNLVSRYGTHTMWAGVACYPAHAFSADEIVAQSRDALSSARDWNQDRIEVAIAE